MAKNIDLLPEVHYESLANLETSYWWHLTRLNRAEYAIRKYFTAPSELNVLDYGCGTGGFLHELNKRFNFKSCLGVDASPLAVQYAKKYGDHYAVINSGDLNPVRGKDLILIMDVMEHIKDDEGFAKSLIDIMSPGAYALIMSPAFPALYSEWDKVLGHYRRYTKKSLGDVLNKSGGTVVCMEYFFSFLVLPIFLRRLLKKSYKDDNCEFPPVPPVLNRILLFFSRLEMLVSRLIRCPAGTTIICLMKKK
ncbi:MAG: class I SAM-dependent methyltransferase [Nitrospirae bacterium]|nr:class I SAM-dependent methyltransferase [Nitrospirota bacterium]